LNYRSTKHMPLITGLAERIEDGGPHELDHKVVGFRPTGRVRSTAERLF